MQGISRKKTLIAIMDRNNIQTDGFTIGESGTPEELLVKFGLTTEAIVAAVHGTIKMKKQS